MNGNIKKLTPNEENKHPIITSLACLRDVSPLSSRNTSKGALIKETFNVFSAVKNGLPLIEIRQAILYSQLLQKPSFETRRKIWNAISHRYLSVYPEWVARAMANATTEGTQSADFISLAYFYYAIRDSLTFEFVTGPVWKKWQRQSVNIDQNDFLAFLEQKAEKLPHIKKWREVTRNRLASMTLSALRDFGLLKGKQKKQIQRPPLSPDTIYHVLSLLYVEGKAGMDILEAPDWRLFLLSDADVVVALSNLAQIKWIRFEKSGRTVMLQMERLPGVNE